MVLYQRRWLDTSTKATYRIRRASLCYKRWTQPKAGQICEISWHLCCITLQYLHYSWSNLIFWVRHCFSELVRDFIVDRKLNHMMPHVLCHRHDRPLIMGSVFPVRLSAHTYGCVTPDATVWCCEIRGYVCHMSPPIAEHKLTLNVGLLPFFVTRVSWGAILFSSLGFSAKGFILRRTVLKSFFVRISSRSSMF